MTKFGFDMQAANLCHKPANDHDTNVRCAVETTSRPCLVTLESGIQALIEIAGFTYVDGTPIAIGAGLAEDIDPSKLLERGPDGIRLKLVDAASLAGPGDVESHR